MDCLELGLVVVTFVLAIATFWMAYESREHVRLARAQYLADHAPLIEPRILRCSRHKELLSAALALQNVGTSTLVIYRVGIISQNDRRPRPSSVAPEHLYPMAAATLYPGREMRLHLELPVNDSELTGSGNVRLDIGVWTLHVCLSILGFPKHLETWTVFARIRYEHAKFQVDLTTFPPQLDERTAQEKLRNWRRRMRRRRAPRRQLTSLDISRR